MWKRENATTVGTTALKIALERNIYTMILLQSSAEIALECLVYDRSRSY